MLGRHPVAEEGGEVLARAVSRVAVEAVRRERVGEGGHVPVARDLRDDAGRGDGKAQAIALDEGALGGGDAVDRMSVDEDDVGEDGWTGHAAGMPPEAFHGAIPVARGEGGEGGTHRQARRLARAEGIHRAWVDPPDGG